MSSTPNLVGPFVRRVRISNYKSIEKCDVELKPLTVLVGRNGAGKSNFLDALSLIPDSLRTNLGEAIRARGGINDVLRWSAKLPRSLALEVEVLLRDDTRAVYGLELAAEEKGVFTVKHEQLTAYQNRNVVASYTHQNGSVECSLANPPPAVKDRLYLPSLAGYPYFRKIFEALGEVGFYNLNPTSMREFQSPYVGDLLLKDGRNVASVVGRLRADRPEVMERVESYLAAIVPSITGVNMVTLGPRETLSFMQRVLSTKDSWPVYAASMSDGTLRALGCLVAVFQALDSSSSVRMVGIEEPEAALHPAAAGALLDAFQEASLQTQVVITTHSPDLASQVDAVENALLVVQADEGVTRIARADKASLESIRSHLYDAGELLRMDQLQPDKDDLARQDQMTFFRHEAA